MTRRRAATTQAGVLAMLIAAALVSCKGRDANAPIRASGYVEATEVRVAPEVGGRVLELRVAEGDRIDAGHVIAKLDTADAQLALRRVEGERDQAIAQLRLLQAGARVEDVRQAQAQAESAGAEVRAAEAELESATADLQRFEALLQSNAGSRKQRDDAATQRNVAVARLQAARERTRASTEVVARLRAGSRAEEIAAAKARVQTVDAHLATLQKNVSDAELQAPVGGIVTAKLIDAGETIAPRMPVVVITDLDHAWANVYVDEPLVPRLQLGQKLPIVTDAGQRLEGTITFISPKAEFTPRNVQTSEERSKLVYRIKVTTDNHEGVLKPGMPIEAEIPREH